MEGLKRLATHNQMRPSIICHYGSSSTFGVFSVHYPYLHANPRTASLHGMSLEFNFRCLIGNVFRGNSIYWKSSKIQPVLPIIDIVFVSCSLGFDII